MATTKKITKNQIFRALGLKAKMKGASTGGEWFADSGDFLTSVNPVNGEVLARIEQGSPARRETRFLELPQGHVMDVVPITGQLVGHTLRELKLPQRFKVTVVAASIRDPKTGKYQRVPARADIRMREGDRIVVTGDKLDVMALQAADTDTEVTECIPKSPR